MKHNISIAIDGPAASGKSTTAREVARRLGYIYIDTGAMYRAITRAALDAGVDMNDADALERVARSSKITLEIKEGQQHTFLNGRDVSGEIRTPEIDRNITPVATHPGVRRIMVEQQRQLAQNGGVVMDGRDIGTVVLPGAELKIFMEASIEARARRRLKEQTNGDSSLTLESIKADLARRDHADSTRADGPLKKAPDAIVIDTSHMSIEEQVEKIVQLARERQQ
ncbi:MAG TPA: (d)CMP kinase [Caldithrix abyssi]|uniref:Cytidylate kinase n=1 Tax=Caldithrix abyssi TaxID=187145 RepID=A0A7V1PUB8_CALAY|nr:(d)CMP kinase [Caldithrix abyssi]